MSCFGVIYWAQRERDRQSEDERTTVSPTCLILTLFFSLSLFFFFQKRTFFRIGRANLRVASASFQLIGRHHVYLGNTLEKKKDGYAAH